METRTHFAHGSICWTMLACGGDAKPPRRRSRRAGARERTVDSHAAMSSFARSLPRRSTSTRRSAHRSARATEKLFAAIDAYEAGARRRRPRPISRTRSLARPRATAL
jgi:hypothetical protein